MIKPLLILAGIGLVSAAIILYGRGYRLDLQQKSILPKGLLVANSQPNGASIFINGKFTSATNTTLTLEPGWYTIRLEKEGYSPWEKRIRIQGEVVAKTDAVLFPINPSLSPLTITGASNPQVSPDNNKIVFNVSKNNNSDQKNSNGSGVFILELNDRPLAANRNARQIAANSPHLSFENATYTWDPNSKQIIAQVNNRYFLLDANTFNNNPLEVTSLLTTIQAEWQRTKETLEKERYSALKKDLAVLFQANTKTIAWSPDETKILYEATASAAIPSIINPPLIGANPTKEEREIKKGRIYVYDLKEDKNFFITDNTALPIQWFPTSSHLLVIEEGKISIMDYDATNKVTLYAGPFIGNLAVPWPNGSRIVILTTLNPQPETKPNFYAVNIR